MTSMKSTHREKNQLHSVKNQLFMKKYDLNSKIFPKVTKPERAGIYRDKNDENVSKNVTWSLKSHETVKTRPLSVKIDSTVEKSTSETKNDPWKTTTFSKTRKSSKKEGV